MGSSKIAEHNLSPQLLELIRNGGAQADWNESDSSASSYVKNRTHWTELALEDSALFSTEVAFSSEMVSVNIGADSIKENGKYDASWNGKVYTCTAYAVSGAVYLGNGALVGVADDTGEPFCIEVSSPSASFLVKNTSKAETVAVAITAYAEIVHQIDPKYLPIEDLETAAENANMATENANSAAGVANTAADNANAAAEYARDAANDAYSAAYIANDGAKKANAAANELQEAKESGAFDGETGPQGPKGNDGYTPVKGVDYFTDDDKKELTAGLSQIEAPIIVSSVDEMTDPTKHYVLDGYIYSYRTVATEGVTTSPNVFVPSTATLNGRLSGGSATVTVGSNAYGSFTTDFISVPKYGETTPYNIQLNWELPNHNDNKVVLYNSNKERISHNFISPKMNASIVDGKTIVDIKTLGNSTQGSVAADDADVAFMRLQLFVSDDNNTALTSDDIANCEITLDVNQVTTEGTTTQEWVNSGIPYAPTFKTDLIGVLGENNVVYLSENLPTGTYTLKYPDDNYATIGTMTVE